MDKKRQSSENWLEPVLNARISCHEINWGKGIEQSSISLANGLFLHHMPFSGTALHSHDFTEILIISEGAVLHKVNGEKQYLENGSICFVRPDDLHCFLPVPEFSKCEILMIDFALELFLSLSAFFENDSFLRQLSAPVLPPCFRLNSAYQSELYANFLKLNKPQVQPVLRKIKLKNLLSELFTRFFIDESQLITGSQIPDWIEELCIEMRKKENFLLGLPQMRKLACKTPQHLCKYFNKYLGRSPTDFLNEIRINYAAQLLAESKEEILTIADILSFKSLSQFYHLFKKYYHCTPMSYRNLQTRKS